MGVKFDAILSRLRQSDDSGSTPGGASAWGGITGLLSNQTDLQTALDGKANTYTYQGSSFTAELDGNYVATATLTVTDPAPLEGKGYYVLVQSGTATIGGTDYSTPGTLIRRSYSGSFWSDTVIGAGGGGSGSGDMLAATYDPAGIAQQLVGTTASQSLSNKTIALGSNTVSGTLAQFNAACTDADFVADTATQEVDKTVIAKAASTANLTLSGTQTVDGISLIAGDYCLAKNQSTSSQNGVYVVAAGAWTRATEYSTTADFNKKEVYVSSGTTNGGTWWLCATRNVVVGTTATTFAQVPNGIGTAADQSAAGNHTHASIAATGASSFSNTLLASGAFTNGAALLKRYTSRTATASTAATDNIVVMSGSTAAQIETMPDGVAVANSSGRVIRYVNNASVDWTIRQSASNTLNGSSSDFALKSGRWIEVFNTADNAWVISGYGLNGTESSGGSGSVTSVSVASANGFAGTVANATTTPAITVSTSVTGLLKGNGTAISAAAAGTDYISPTGTENVSNKTITSSSVNGVTLSTAQGTSNFLRGDGTYAAPSAGGEEAKTSDFTAELMKTYSVTPSSGETITITNPSGATEGQGFMVKFNSISGAIVLNGITYDAMTYGKWHFQMFYDSSFSMWNVAAFKPYVEQTPVTIRKSVYWEQVGSVLGGQVGSPWRFLSNQYIPMFSEFCVSWVGSAPIGADARIWLRRANSSSGLSSESSKLQQSPDMAYLDYVTVFQDKASVSRYGDGMGIRIEVASTANMVVGEYVTLSGFSNASYNMTARVAYINDATHFTIYASGITEAETADTGGIVSFSGVRSSITGPMYVQTGDYVVPYVTFDGTPTFGGYGLTAELIITY